MKRTEPFYRRLDTCNGVTVSSVSSNPEFNPQIAVESLIQTLQESPSRDLLHVVLTGGGSGMQVNSQLGYVAASLPDSIWNRVHLWWGDERFVPRDSEQRNDLGIRETLGSFFARDRGHQVAASDDCPSVHAAAHAYAHELKKFANPSPRFTFVMLGMGPDGHIASLFPHSRQLRASEACVAVLDSPKPPPERVTMTFPTLNNSHKTLIFAAGVSKQEALRRVLAPNGSVDETPARGIKAQALEIFG